MTTRSFAHTQKGPGIYGNYYDWAFAGDRSPNDAAPVNGDYAVIAASLATRQLSAGEVEASEGS